MIYLILNDFSLLKFFYSKYIYIYIYPYISICMGTRVCEYVFEFPKIKSHLNWETVKFLSSISDVSLIIHLGCPGKDLYGVFKES